MDAVASPDPAGPHLACSTGAFFARPLREAFERISDAGFRDVEVMVTRDPATQEAHRLHELAAGHDVTIRAIHAPFLLMTRRVWGTDPVGKIYRAIELAEETMVPLVVVHPPYRWQTRYRRWLDDQLPRLSERTGVKVAVENMFPVHLPGRRGLTFHAGQSLEDWERFPDVVLDTSHAAVAGLDPVATARRLGTRLAHVHLSNNAGRGWDSHLPVDQGVLSLDALLDTLGADGFHGTITLELDLRQYLDDAEALRRVLTTSREFCQARLALAA
jgi:sugar phosphate isomerase/epimerase